MVKVIADGSMRIRRITVEPSLIAANDKPMLEDLIVVAVNDALGRAQQLMQEAMGKLGPMGGLKIPGFGGELTHSTRCLTRSSDRMDSRPR